MTEYKPGNHDHTHGDPIIQALAEFLPVLRISKPPEVLTSLEVHTGNEPPRPPGVDFAHVRIIYGDRTVIVRGDPTQTLAEFLMSLFERAGEPIEVEETGGGSSDDA